MPHSVNPDNILRKVSGRQVEWCWWPPQPQPGVWWALPTSLPGACRARPPGAPAAHPLRKRVGGRAAPGAPAPGPPRRSQAGWWGQWQAEPTAPAASDSDPSDPLFVATMVITTCTPRSAEGWGRTLLEGPVLLWTPQLSAQGAVIARQAPAVAAALLSDWLAPQWAPPPSKRPLVSNCPPATVSGPAQPLVGVSVGPAPCHPLYKSPNSDRGRWFVDTIACRVVC